MMGVHLSTAQVDALMAHFDPDGSGEIDRREFRDGIIALGWEIHDPYLLDEVFDTM